MEEALDTLHKRELHKCRVRVRKVRPIIAYYQLMVLLCIDSSYNKPHSALMTTISHTSFGIDDNNDTQSADPDNAL
jgi:hypothetical protein